MHIIGDIPFLVFSVYETTDEYGTRGAYVGSFIDKNIAEATSANKGWWGGNGQVIPTWAIKNHLGKVYLLQSDESINLDTDVQKAAEDIKQRALAKLTVEERRVLGFS